MFVQCFVNFNNFFSSTSLLNCEDFFFIFLILRTSCSLNSAKYRNVITPPTKKIAVRRAPSSGVKSDRVGRVFEIVFCTVEAPSEGRISYKNLDVLCQFWARISCSSSLSMAHTHKSVKTISDSKKKLYGHFKYGEW